MDKGNASLDGRVVLVTGAAHGMGRAHVEELVSRGALVGALDVDETALRAATAPLGDRVSTLVADVSDRAAVRAAVDAFGAEHGLIDAIVGLWLAPVTPHE